MRVRELRRVDLDRLFPEFQAALGYKWTRSNRMYTALNSHIEKLSEYQRQWHYIAIDPDRNRMVGFMSFAKHWNIYDPEWPTLHLLLFELHPDYKQQEAGGPLLLKLAECATREKAVNITGMVSPELRVLFEANDFVPYQLLFRKETGWMRHRTRLSPTRLDCISDAETYTSQAGRTLISEGAQPPTL